MGRRGHDARVTVGPFIPRETEDRSSVEEQARRAELEAIVRAIARRAARARRDPAAFFQFVMREETSRARISTLPHQELIFAFVMAHDRCVLRLPIGTSKTYTMTALSLWLLGQDPTTRGAVISATAGQAAKVVGAARDYIEQSAELRHVFPNLRPSTRDGDPWQQTKFVVERPFGIRDPSLVAVGVDGALPGSRLNWILVDDILDRENTSTESGREKVRHWFGTTVLSRRDVAGAKVVVTNTPWHSEDLTYQLEKQGWPTLTVDIYGNIKITNTDWDSDLIRPSDVDPSGLDHRLTAHDSPAYAPFAAEGLQGHHVRHDGRWRDAEDSVPLWPAKFPREAIEKLREGFLPHEFNMLYCCTVRDEEGAHVRLEWVDRCKQLARERDIYNFVAEWREPFPTYTGVDLAVSRKKKSANSSIFTVAILPGGLRRPLAIEFGRWSGGDIIDRVIEHHRRFGSIVRVETNGAQDFLKQWLNEREASVPTRAHNTGKNKTDVRHGVESIFLEIKQGAWLIPSSPDGSVPSGVKQWLEDMFTYDPGAHTGDVLMSCWLAREQARSSGALAKDANLSAMRPGRGDLKGAIAAILGSR